MGWVFFHTATYVAHSVLPDAEREGRSKSQTIRTNILGSAFELGSSRLLLAATCCRRGVCCLWISQIGAVLLI